MLKTPNSTVSLRYSLLSTFFAVLLLAPAPAIAAPERNLAVAGSEKRVALVIGNAAYPGAPLANPVNDAHDMAAALKKLGFDVIEKTDATQKEMNRAIAQFGEKLRADTVALFFYAGHGMQVKGKNYLIPIDAHIQSESSARVETVDVDGVLDQLAVSPLNIVILDACRNNPFERRFRSAGGGLAQMDAPKGSLIAYATAPGKVASDGNGRNGLYTQELLRHIQTPGLPLEAVFKRVRNGVMAGSGEAQTPWEASSLTGDFYFIFQGPTTVQVQPSASDPEEETWAAAQSANSSAGYRAYLDAYPGGRFAAAARIKLGGAGKPPPLAQPAEQIAASAARPDDTETPFWNEVKSSGAREYFEAYLKQYAKGKYAALAKIELKKLDERDKAEQARLTADRKAAAERERQTAIEAEQDAWQRAKIGDSADAYAVYLDAYPRGRYATLAQAARQKLQREANEREKRETVQRQREAEQQRLAEEKARRETEKEAAVQRPGKVIKDCADCPEMVMIPAGGFSMGSPSGEAGRDSDEGPQHRVSVKSFALGKYEVTVGEFRSFVQASGYRTDAEKNAGGKEGCWAWDSSDGKWEYRAGRYWDSPGFAQSDRQPAACISWNDAKAYVAWLSKKSGKGFRLPSEAEWEYAARAGSTTARFWGDNPDQACRYANVADKTGGPNGQGWGEKHDCSDGYFFSAPVGSFEANVFGLHDMLGNAWEWTEDCGNGNYTGAPTDGSAWTSGNCGARVLRGGSWNNNPRNVRSAKRNRNDTANRNNNTGFRLARTPAA